MLKRYGWIAALALVLDQLTKLWAQGLGDARLVLIPGVVGLTYVENTGMAFSSFSGYTGVLAVLSFVVSVLLAVAIWKKWLPHPFCQWMLTLILAGAVGNLIDRAFLGYVTDMIQVLFIVMSIWGLRISQERFFLRIT